MTLVNFELFDTLVDIIRLKQIPRTGWKKLGLDSESVADHSYSVAILAMILSDIKGLNTFKIIRMALLHDLAESVIGDYTPDDISISAKYNLESDAMKKITGSIPQFGENYESLWEEYAANKTLESQLVHQIDRLDMAFQARYYYDNGCDPKLLEKFLISCETDISDPFLIKLLTRITTHIRKDHKHDHCN